MTEDLAEETKEDSAEGSDCNALKKPRGETEAPEQKEAIEPSSSATAEARKETGEETGPEEKPPRSRARRKGKPHKCT